MERLKQYWSTFTDAWLEGGPENPENVLVHVEAHPAEYWDSPGSTVTQVVNLVKAKAAGEDKPAAKDEFSDEDLRF